MTVIINTEELALDLWFGGNATYAVNPGVSVPTSGYVVAIADQGFELHLGDLIGADRAEKFGQLKSWIERVKGRASFEHCYLGRWTDDNSGVVYFDVVKIFSTSGPALHLAAATGELAIFDLAAGEEIRVAGDTEAETYWILVQDYWDHPDLTAHDFPGGFTGKGIPARAVNGFLEIRADSPNI